MSPPTLPISPPVAVALAGSSSRATAPSVETRTHLQAERKSTTIEPRSWLDVAITRVVFVPGDANDVFDFVAAEDVLPKVLTGYGLVPGVVSTSNVTGPWNEPGSSRTVHLGDGNTAHEAVTAYVRPGYFSYRVSDPTFSLRYLISGARGEWWLTPARGGTQVRWTYTFRAKGPLALLPLMLFAHTQWSGYMNVCLRHVTRHFNGRDIEVVREQSAG